MHLHNFYSLTKGNSRRKTDRKKGEKIWVLSFRIFYISVLCVATDDKWVPVTTAWRVLRLRMEERPPTWRVAANILNKQSRTADKGLSTSLGIRRRANNSSP